MHMPVSCSRNMHKRTKLTKADIEPGLLGDFTCRAPMSIHQGMPIMTGAMAEPVAFDSGMMAWRNVLLIATQVSLQVLGRAQIELLMGMHTGCQVHRYSRYSTVTN